MSNDKWMDTMNINELAGASGLMIGALGGLIAIILKSRCECDLNLCYIWRCHRKPPPLDDDSSADEETVVPDKPTSPPKGGEEEREEVAHLNEPVAKRTRSKSPELTYPTSP